MYEDSFQVRDRHDPFDPTEPVSSGHRIAVIHDGGDARALDELSIRAAAEKALDQVFDGARVGFGSGHAVSVFLAMLGTRIRQGLRITGVAASEASAGRARAAGIPLVALDGELDIAVDGADEVAPNLDLVKGHGGAMVRERIVAAASKRQIIIVSETKLVRNLGEHAYIPVEVIPLAHWLVARKIDDLGVPPVRRQHRARRQPLFSENRNFTLDCAPFKPLADEVRARKLERALLALPGVVDTGLFLGTAHQVFVGHANGDVDVLRRPEASAARTWSLTPHRAHSGR
jgi:ribose 5-phosphate isomerase A